MITVIDLDMGNFGSVLNICRKIEIKAKLTNDTEEIEKADKIILPGVGHFDNAMINLEKLGLIAILNKKILKDKIPILGICLGMQLLSYKSEEGKLPGLGWIEGEVIKFNLPEKYKLPHMGWNYIKSVPNCQLFRDIKKPRFYFVHNYHFVCQNPDNVMCKTQYGYDFVSGIWKNNIYGVQFHPEKSHSFGKKFLKNFDMI